VHSLDGMECFKNVTNLGIFHSDFVDLSPLAGLPLTELHLSDSAVVDASPLAGSPTLETLVISDSPRGVTPPTWRDVRDPLHTPAVRGELPTPMAPTARAISGSPSIPASHQAGARSH